MKNVPSLDKYVSQGAHSSPMMHRQESEVFNYYSTVCDRRHFGLSKDHLISGKKQAFTIHYVIGYVELVLSVDSDTAHGNSKNEIKKKFR